jgi:hypothetical protein
LQQSQYNGHHTAVASSGQPSPTPIAYNSLNFASAKSLASNGERENIQVVVRCRPFIRDELARGGGVGKKSVTMTQTSVSAQWKVS